LQAQPVLSPAARISVITCGPDTRELYAAFGHSAIRVYDPANGLDEAFNYGVFNFNQPNFYLNFAKGFLFYKLGVYSYPDFEAYYLENDRYVHEQVLHLSADQKEKIFQFLVWNARPENQNYRYQYYQNNCATKIRDVLQSQLGAAIRWDSAWLQPAHSFRQKTDEHLDRLPWGDMGIDLCLGLPIDRRMHAWEYMFLPGYVEDFTDHAFIKMDSVWVPLVAEKRRLEKSAIHAEGNVFHPWVAMGLLAAVALAISIWDNRRKRLSKWLDVLLFGGAGLIGILLLSLWLFTDHTDAARNFNLLWAFPLHFVGMLFLLRNNKSALTRNYFLFAAMLSAGTVLFWWAWPQEMNPFFIPIVAALGTRSGVVWKLSAVRTG